MTTFQQDRIDLRFTLVSQNLIGRGYHKEQIFEKLAILSARQTRYCARIQRDVCYPNYQFGIIDPLVVVVVVGGSIAVEEDKSKKLIWIAMFLQALVSYLLITSVFSSVDIQNANKMKSCYSCLKTTKHCCTFLRFSSVISRAFQLLPLQLNYIFTRKRHTTR